MSIKKFFLYYNTIKYIKITQVLYRLIRRIFPLKTFFLYPKTLPSVRCLPEHWKQPYKSPNCLLSQEPLIFTFLNKSTHIRDWNDPAIEKLWLYNLHYHSFVLSSLPWRVKKEILTKWIEQNPWPQGVGWEPYPLSLRIVHWVKFFLSHPSSQDEEYNSSLFLQGYSLYKQIEYHLLGNHLFENGKALLFAGIYFDTKESLVWFKKGVDILQKQIKEQILEDGGHFERSPMYHAIILEGLLDVYQLILLSQFITKKEIRVPLEELKGLIDSRVPKMLCWLHLMSHPDGKIAFFNDSTLGVAPDNKDLFQYAASLGFTDFPSKRHFTHLQKSGYIRAENKSTAVLADVGSLGPSYIPGHAHAETLSFECSLGNERLFVNSGISTYEVNEKRAAQRGTLAHNTLAVDNANSSEVWSSFRVAGRARVREAQVSLTDEGIYFWAAHDGYIHTKYELIHRREWYLMEGALVIEDFVMGKGEPMLTSSFHLHPQWKIMRQEEGKIRLASQSSHRSVSLDTPSNCDITLQSYEYNSGFNKTEKSHCIRLVTQRPLPLSLRTQIQW